MNGLDLAEVIKALRAELEQAMVAGADAQLRFEAKTLTVELQVAVTRSVEASAGVKFWVLDAGAGASSETQTVQTVTLELAPITADGRPAKIAAGTDIDPRG